jgi:hypothetical protein
MRAHLKEAEYPKWQTQRSDYPSGATSISSQSHNHKGHGESHLRLPTRKAFLQYLDKRLGIESNQRRNAMNFKALEARWFEYYSWIDKKLGARLESID